MAVIAIGSVRGAPGVTSLALDLARHASSIDGGVLLLEADPDGGCLAARLDLAVRPGLTELAGAARSGISPDDVCRFAQPFEGLSVVCAHPAAEQVQAALRAAANHIGVAVAALGGHVVIDLGRLRPGSPSLALTQHADRVVVVNDNDIESIISLSHRTELLRGLGEAVVVMSSNKPYNATEIGAATGLAVWGSMPHLAQRREQRGRRIAVAALWSSLTEGLEAAAVAEAPSSDLVAVGE